MKEGSQGAPEELNLGPPVHRARPTALFGADVVKDGVALVDLVQQRRERALRGRREERRIERGDLPEILRVVELRTHEFEALLALGRVGQTLGGGERRLHGLNHRWRVHEGEQFHRCLYLRVAIAGRLPQGAAVQPAFHEIDAAQATVERLVERAHLRCGGGAERAQAVFVHGLAHVQVRILDGVVEHPVLRPFQAEQLAVAAAIHAMDAVVDHHLREVAAAHPAALGRVAERLVAAPHVDVGGEALGHLVVLPLRELLRAHVAQFDHHVRRKLPKRLRRLERGRIAEDVHDLSGTLLQQALGDVAMEPPDLLADVFGAGAAKRLAVLAFAELPAVLLRQLHDVGTFVELPLQLLDDELLHLRIRDAERGVLLVGPDPLPADKAEILGMLLEILGGRTRLRIGMAAVAVIAAASEEAAGVVVEGRAVRRHGVFEPGVVAAERPVRHLDLFDLRDVRADITRRQEAHVHVVLHEPRNGPERRDGSHVPRVFPDSGVDGPVAAEDVDVAALLGDHAREVLHVGRHKPGALRRRLADVDCTPALETLGRC